MGGGRVDLRPWQVVSDSAAMEQRAAAATSEILASVNDFGMPMGSTSPHGALIAGQIAGIIPAVTPQVVRTQQQQRAIDDATKHGAKIVVDRDTEGGELFRSEDQRVQQIGQMASQGLGGVAQAPAQAVQGTTQSAQQVGQTAGQAAQQTGQAVSQTVQQGSAGATQSGQQNVDQDGGRSKSTDERAISKPVLAAGAGGAGGGTGGGSGGVQSGTGMLGSAAALSKTSGAGAGSPSTARTSTTVTTTTTGTPIGGMSGAPLSRSGKGDGEGVRRGSELDETAPLVDGALFPAVDQQIGALPVFELASDDEGPPFETIAFGDK